MSQPPTDDEMKAWAKKNGYKKRNELTDEHIAIWSYVCAFLSLVLTNLIIFIFSATFILGSDGMQHWYMPPQAWQTFIIAVLQAFQVLVVGKVANYLEQKKKIKVSDLKI
jgi:ABC-type Fe3+ transport system permease subunit